jgi:DNA polymerase III subunit gamma/tau
LSTLYNRYRPTTFDEMVGNESAIASLQKAITKKNHSHAYMLSGPSGCGKTTVARIMAKNILGASDICINEINSSSDRGIDTAREIIQQMRYSPSDGNVTIFILDEAHKLNNNFMNAILKALEEPPEFVYFFICTTEPSKIITTIRNRCTEIKFKALGVEELSEVINRVLKLEKIKLSNEVIESISEKAEGSPRKSLVILQSVIGFETEKEQLEYLSSNTTNDEDPEIIELARALINKDNQWKDIARILKKLKENNKLDEPETVRYIILGYMSAVLLNGSMNKRAILIMDAFKDNTFNTGKFGIIFDASSIFI